MIDTEAKKDEFNEQLQGGFYLSCNDVSREQICIEILKTSRKQCNVLQITRKLFEGYNLPSLIVAKSAEYQKVLRWKHFLIDIGVLQ